MRLNSIPAWIAGGSLISAAQTLFYRLVWLLGAPSVWLASRPCLLHRERVAGLAPGYLLAANHVSPFDAPLLMLVTPRMIWWLSIVELFQNRFSRTFLSALGAMPLDRHRPDPTTVRKVVRHLRAGRVVGMFPEGGLRTGENSVLRSGELHEGVCRLARLAGVPILPCVVLGGEQFWRWTAWVPFAGTRWVVAFGEPLHFPSGPGQAREKSAAMRGELTLALRNLAREARQRCPEAVLSTG